MTGHTSEGERWAGGGESSLQLQPRYQISRVTERGQRDQLTLREPRAPTCLKLFKRNGNWRKGSLGDGPMG